MNRAQEAGCLASVPDYPCHGVSLAREALAQTPSAFGYIAGVRIPGILLTGERRRTPRRQVITIAPGDIAGAVRPRTMTSTDDTAMYLSE